MRKVIYGMNISLDGGYDHTKFTPDEEMMDFFANYMQDIDLMVYGRKMYELMFPYWSDVARDLSGSKAENEFATRITNTDKVVFSRTLESLEGNARIIRGGLEEEIIRLKQLPGKTISIGSVQLREQLTALGLIDEYYFVLHPIITGEGKRFMDGIILNERIQLKLVTCKVFKSGKLGLHYVKA